MKTKQIFFFLVVILMIGYGCKKDSESTDLTSGKTGTYVGSLQVVGLATVNANCSVTKVSNTSANLVLTVVGQPVSLPGVSLSDGGSGKVNLSYSDSSGTLTGSIENATLTFTLQAGSVTEIFTGDKQ
jgi:hypothetical protein